MLTEIRVYPGANGTFSIYDDDGVTNTYKAGAGRNAVLRWDDSAKRLTATGTLPTGQHVDSLVKLASPELGTDAGRGPTGQ